MSNENIIHFGMLGTFSLKGGGEEKPIDLTTGKKALSLLQYLIVNHNRNISKDELLEKFYGDDNSNAPYGALRTMLVKVRGLLDEILPGKKNLIQTFSGYYQWDKNYQIVLDIEQFEALCMKARKSQDDESLDLMLQAIDLYKGDFLEANDSDWVFVLRQYYRTLFLDICKVALPLLYKKESWVDILNIAGRAYGIDFTVEDFTAYPMQALIALGQPAQAIKIYEVFEEQLQREFDVEPSDRVRKLYKLASDLRKKDVNLNDIFKLVSTDGEEQMAFLCTFEVFHNIVKLERRHMARSGQPSSLVVVGLDSQSIPNTDTRRLEQVLLKGLRTGDAVARLEIGSYILMLTGANEENANKVMERLEKNFHSKYPNSKVEISYQIEALREE